MRLFECQSCRNPIYFENVRCEVCGHALGYLASETTMTALEPARYVNTWRPLLAPAATVRYCDNARWAACNWLVDVADGNGLCLACRHNNVIPDTGNPENLRRWRLIELAKHRLFYSLVRLRLPMPTREERPATGLAFDFLADLPYGPKVMTGHDNGLITLAVREADDAERTTLRQMMNEPYRTLLGHFRHEVGHYYWDRLVRDEHHLAACRAVFGDDAEDYEAALKRHYERGVPANWQASHVSAYATTHPWEDFAETWAHYLHIVDTLETANAFGIRVAPALTKGAELSADIAFDAYEAADAKTLVDAWLPLTFAVNSLNRAMGQPDLYPFVLSPPVVGKLEFIHRLVHGSLPAP